MSTPGRAYFLVEPGPLLDACEDWRRRYLAHRAASVALSESKGSDGIWSDTPNGATSGLSLVEPVPSGWVKKKARRGDVYFMEPAKGPAGDVARAELAALPPMPNHYEIAVLIGHPGNSVHSIPQGAGDEKQYEDIRYAAYFYYEAMLLWLHDDEAPLQIAVTDLEPTIAEIKNARQNSVITKGHWTPPAGLNRDRAHQNRVPRLHDHEGLVDTTRRVDADHRGRSRTHDCTEPDRPRAIGGRRQ